MIAPWYTTPMGRILLGLFVGAALGFGMLAKADVVEFSDEELSRESVLPVFDQPEAVKKRVVPTYQRIEAAAYLGLSLNDAFINTVPVGVDVEYHLTEIHALGLNAAYFITSASSYVTQIQQQVPGAVLIPFANNPAPQFMLLGEYEFTPFYGKISVTKQGVANLNIGGTIRAGMLFSTPTESSPVIGIGLNQRFFITRNFGLKLDLQALLYQKTDIIAIPASKNLVTNIMMSLGALWYFPQL
jgi:outer membrane beta-barrel protein